MFNKNFYPSSNRVIRLLKGGLPKNLERVLEPSAGKGDLADSFNSQVDWYATYIKLIRYPPK